MVAMDIEVMNEIRPVFGCRAARDASRLGRQFRYSFSQSFVKVPATRLHQRVSIRSAVMRLPGVHKQLVIFNITAKSESGTLIFDTCDAHPALEANRRLGISKAAGWNGDNTLQAFAKLERLPGNAVKPIAGKVFSGALDGRSSGIAEQVDWPMQGDAFSLSAFFGYHHDRRESLSSAQLQFGFQTSAWFSTITDVIYGAVFGGRVTSAPGCQPYR
jgi:hypothetical protein